MAFGFGSGPAEATCRFCDRAMHPELLAPLSVPYLGQEPYQVCPACRDDYLSSGWELQPFTPSLPLPGHWVWPAPRTEDLDGTEGELRAGVEAYLEGSRRLARLAREEPAVRAHLEAAPPARPLSRLWLREPPLAELAFGLDPELRALLESAWEALDDALPSYSPSTERHARVAFLLARLTLELGPRAPRSYGPRKAGPAVWLKELRDQARHTPALRDPRIPLVRALLFREEDNLAAADRELHQALDQLEGLPPERWRDATFTAHYDLHLRAVGAGRPHDALPHLKRCCALRPDDTALFLRLARAYLAAAQPHVAREVLAARLGPRRVTPEAIREAISGSLNELRPLLEARGGDAALPLLYATCLRGLGEYDAAWRALDGAGLLEALEDDAPRPELAELHHLGGLIALDRGEHEAGTCLLAAAFASAAPAARAVVRNDLLCAIARATRELLEDLEERTRTLTHEEELARAIRGPQDPSDRLARPGLEQVHEGLRRHTASLMAATSEHERTVFADFLGRELSSGFRPLVTPPSLADRSDLRVADARVRLDLAYRALAKRRLPDALREDRGARDASGHATPFHLILTYLELVRRGGPRILGWAIWAWTRLPARRPPIEVGLLIVSEDDLATRELGALLELFDEPARGPTVGRPSLRGLQSRCRLQLPREGRPLELARDPAVRAYVRALFEECPAFPFLLDMRPEAGQLELFFGALASPDAIEDDGSLRLDDASVLAPVRRALTAIRALAEEAGLDPAAACAPLRERYPGGLPE